MLRGQIVLLEKESIQISDLFFIFTAIKKKILAPVRVDPTSSLRILPSPHGLTARRPMQLQFVTVIVITIKKTKPNRIGLYR